MPPELSARLGRHDVRHEYYLHIGPCHQECTFQGGHVLVLTHPSVLLNAPRLPSANNSSGRKPDAKVVGCICLENDPVGRQGRQHNRNGYRVIPSPFVFDLKLPRWPSADQLKHWGPPTKVFGCAPVEHELFDRQDRQHIRNN